MTDQSTDQVSIGSASKKELLVPWSGQAWLGIGETKEKEERLYRNWLYPRKPIVTRVGLVMLLHGHCDVCKKESSEVIGH